MRDSLGLIRHMTPYDRAKWHYGGSFPPSQPRENGGTHIGFFLAWTICNDLESEWLRAEFPDALAALRARKITGTRFLFDQCDEALTNDMFGEEGLAFADYYYGGDTGPSRYLDDYARVFGPMESTLYRIVDTWDNYDLIAPVMSEAFAEWKKRKARPWWRFWGD